MVGDLRAICASHLGWGQTPVRELDWSDSWTPLVVGVVGSRLGTDPVGQVTSLTVGNLGWGQTP
jgi:hypothetical protein